jgi:dTDP-4-amino-4,6-dideoxygalactose transaminase
LREQQPPLGPVFPEPESVACGALALPIYPEISREAQRYVLNAIVEFFQ